MIKFLRLRDLERGGLGRPLGVLSGYGVPLQAGLEGEGGGA